MSQTNRLDKTVSKLKFSKTMIGANQVTARDQNERLVLHLVRRHGTITKRAAIRATGLSPTAISTIFKALENDHLLLRDDPLRGQIGQPSVPLRLNPDARFYIGFKIGLRSLDMVIVDFCGCVRARRSQIHKYPTPLRVSAFIKTALPFLLAKAKLKHSQISASGIAMPTAIWELAKYFDAPVDEMQAWRDFDVVFELRDLLPGLILLENDGTAACRAELISGSHEKFANSIYFFVGTFIGGGIVLDGAVFSGCFGTSGGFGFLRVPSENGDTRLLDHASLMTLNQMLEAHENHTLLWNIENDQWEELDPVLSQWITQAAGSIAHAIATTASVIDFNTVIIDGAFAKPIRARLCGQVQAKLALLDQSGFIPPKIRPGNLGSEARAVGAAAMHISSGYMIESPIRKQR